MRAQDRPHIRPKDTRLLRGSADIDAAHQALSPNENRWDFAIGVRHANWGEDFIYWVEIHTANDKEVGVVLRKLEWLKRWLVSDGQLLDKFERDFIWVSSGATAFTADGPQSKRFAEKGLLYAGRVLRIASNRPK